MSSSRLAQNKSRPETVLERACRIQEKWAGGASLAEELAQDRDPILHHGLLTLFRQQATIDWIINRYSPRPVRPRLRRVLRWTICQILYQTGLHPAVAADMAVAFVKTRYSRTEAGFVNALLHKIVAASPATLLQAVQQEAPSEVRLGLSPELFAAWSKRFPPELLVKLAAVLQEPASPVFRLRAGASAPDAASGLELLPGPAWAPSARLYHSPNPAAFLASPEFSMKRFYLQDPSTLLAPALLEVRPGERVADLCAAPGGKAVLLAEALFSAPGDTRGRLVCLERSRNRLARLRENLQEFPQAWLIAGDAARPPFPPASFDAILLDVPCSNTGVIRRRPDVRWRFTRANLASLQELQATILAGTAPLLRPGGRLVYSTCSLEPGENGEQVRHFLAQHPAFTLEQEQQLLPCHEHDGAYAARLRLA